MNCNSCAKPLLKEAGGKLKLRNKGVLAFSLIKGRVVCEMVCPLCNEDTVIPIELDGAGTQRLEKASSTSRPVTFYIRPPTV